MGPNYELLQFEGDGTDGADAFCVDRGYALAGAFSEFTGVSSVWSVGTMNMALNESWTGTDAVGYLYITCLSSDSIDPNIANSTNGNIGAYNVRAVGRRRWGCADQVDLLCRCIFQTPFLMYPSLPALSQTGSNNIGNNNTGDGNVGNLNAGNWNLGDGHANGSDSNIGFYNIGIGNVGTLNNGTGNIGYGNIGTGNTDTLGLGLGVPCACFVHFKPITCTQHSSRCSGFPPPFRVHVT